MTVPTKTSRTRRRAVVGKRDMFAARREANRTFKPLKKVAEGTRRHKLHLHAQATLGAGDLREAVRLPVGEDINDWYAVNVTDFFNEVSLLYGTPRPHLEQEVRPFLALEPRHAQPRHLPCCPTTAAAESSANVRAPRVSVRRRADGHVHARHVPAHDRRAEIRVQVGRRRANQEADPLLRPQVRRLPDDVGADDTRR